MLELECSLKKVSPVRDWFWENLTVPNVITLFGFYLTFKLIYILYTGTTGIIILYYFSGAAATDLLDGLTARIFNQKTKLGGMLDKTRDKLLIISTFYFALQTYKLSSEPIARLVFYEINSIIIIEFILSAIAGMIILASGKVRANTYGRYKMVFECASAICWIMIYSLHLGNSIYNIHALWLMYFFITASLIFALASSFYQIKDNYQLIPRIANTIRIYFNWH